MNTSAKQLQITMIHSHQDKTKITTNNSKNRRTLHLSFDEDSTGLYNEILRRSALSYVPATKIARFFMAEGMKQHPEMFLPRV